MSISCYRFPDSYRKVKSGNKMGTKLRNETHFVKKSENNDEISGKVDFYSGEKIKFEPR